MFAYTLYIYITALHSNTGFSLFFLDKGILHRLLLLVLMRTDIKMCWVT